jgi:hypothetical protein
MLKRKSEGDQRSEGMCNNDGTVDAKLNESLPEKLCLGRWRPQSRTWTATIAKSGAIERDHAMALSRIGN